jgi:hypothetical protein
MSLSQKIAAVVDAGPDAVAIPCDVAVEEGPLRLVLHVTATGPVGLAFDRLDFSTSDRPEWSTEALRGWGERLAARLTYLMEPLRVLEVDPQDGEVELRSQVPTLRNGSRSYYEIRLNRRGALRLTRVAFDEGTRKRTVVAGQMTREVLERLADDLVASVA